ncbi:MAG: hypothetical protein J4G03_06855 [Gemmatimonadetes bacterium]|nr:hypothetical protein [Gemmatimonadota bacterium]
MAEATSRAGEPVERWRLAALGIFAFGSVGLLGEMILLEHHDSNQQWIPIIVLALGLAVSAALLCKAKSQGRIDSGWRGARSLIAVSWIYLTAAPLGVFFHTKGNLEFEQELRPNAGGLEHFTEALFGAFPALAPGALAALGLVGLLVTMRKETAS